MKISDNEKNVLRGIGNYFMEKNLKEKQYEEAYSDTCRTILTMNITGIETIDEEKYKITLCRPGLLIGARGKDINAINKALNIKISIEENLVPDYVFPVDIYRFEEVES